MTEHKLKTSEPYFSAIASGEKTFDIRQNDRGFQKGDTLVLIDADGCECGWLECGTRRPPIKKTITYVFAPSRGLADLGGVLPGYVVLALADVETANEATS